MSRILFLTSFIHRFECLYKHFDDRNYMFLDLQQICKFFKFQSCFLSATVWKGYNFCLCLSFLHVSKYIIFWSNNDIVAIMHAIIKHFGNIDSEISLIQDHVCRFLFHKVCHSCANSFLTCNLYINVTKCYINK